MGGFSDWVETIAGSRSGLDYRRGVKDSETVSMWQSLGSGPNYKAAYCMAVCPAGDDVISPYLASKKGFADEIMRPLQAKHEPIYVIAGSDAEAHVKRRYPHKTVRHVRGSLRPRTITAFLRGMPLSFQREAAGKLEAIVHFSFTGREKVNATVTIRSGILTVERGHNGNANVHVVADSSTWLGFLAREKSLLWALLTRRIRLKGNPKWLLAFQRCFPS